ncbi:MAG: dihydroxy-acid dehydratase, partial [Bradyrhizobium sp.]
LAPTKGTCMVMGTASTMGCIVETLGMGLPNSGSIPATHSDRLRVAEATGKLAAEMAVKQGPRPSEIMTKAAFRNALTVLQAIGGSTNALVHLLAMARRAGMSLSLDRFDELAQRTPLIANLRPSGKYLMEDFYYAGGLRALLVELGDLIDPTTRTINTRTLGENIAGAQINNDDVIRRCTDALLASGGLAVLKGTLAPDGAVIKPGAMEPHLLKHKGRAVVFENYNDMATRIDDPTLDVDANSVLVLKSAGPIGGPGFPEWGQLPIPKKLLAQGVRDMVRISDARMSGTSYGACVLHVAPESAVGGPLAWVRSGDMIELDVPNRRIDLRLSAEELEERRRAWVPPPARYARGYGAMFSKHITQANEGCDFDFLEGVAPTAEPEIH